MSWEEGGRGWELECLHHKMGSLSVG